MKQTIIQLSDDNKLTFADITIGDWFCTGGHLYLKMDKEFAWHFTSGMTTRSQFLPDEPCRRAIVSIEWRRA